MVVVQVFARGSSAWQRRTFAATFRIGSTADCELALPDLPAPTTIVVADPDVHVETRDGRLNGYPIDPDFLHVVHVDDVLVLGGHRIVFELVCGTADDVERYLGGKNLHVLDETESRLLEDLRANPADVATLEVYADWLDDRERPLLAEYIRLQNLRDAGVAGEPSQFQSRWLSASPRAVELRMRDLSRYAEPWWRALLTRRAVTGCPQRSEACEGWHAIPAVEDVFERTCLRCQRDVRFCSTLDELAAQSRIGNLVAIDPAVPVELGERAYFFPGSADDEITIPRLPEYDPD